MPAGPFLFWEGCVTALTTTHFCPPEFPFPAEELREASGVTGQDRLSVTVTPAVILALTPTHRSTTHHGLSTVPH